MRLLTLILALVFWTGVDFQQPSHAEGRKDLVQKLKKRTSWPRSQKGVRLSLIVGKWIAEHRFGWRNDQWEALRALWSHESGWRWWALNPSSGACGIPQFVPCSKGRGDFRTNAVTQIRQGALYIRDRYRAPIGACLGDCQSGTY
jgi:hypothetical protein